MMQEQSHVPIIFLTGHRDSETLQRAVLTGPLGYLIKPFQEDELRCAIEVAIHKHRAERRRARARGAALRRSAELLQNLSLIDELTQLRNRRGFFELAQQALKVAQREHYAHGRVLHGSERPETHQRHARPPGRRPGAARCRRSAARIHFAAPTSWGASAATSSSRMAHVHSTQDLHALGGRLREHLQVFNQTRRRPYPLNISVGMTLVDIPTEEDLESLLARARRGHVRREARRPAGRKPPQLPTGLSMSASIRASRGPADVERRCHRRSLTVAGNRCC